MPSSGFQTCARSEEHTSELQSHDNLVCRLLLEKKNQEGNALTARAPGRARARGRESLQLRLHAKVSTGMRWSRSPHLSARYRFFFFFNDTAPPEISPLSLHDALPINDTATTEIYPLSLHDALRSRWSPYH